MRHLAGTPDRGILHWYRDPLPTNCVADWVCSGSQQPGFHNPAVFYASCTLDCLFCQNWNFREVSPISSCGTTAAQLASAANPSTFCVCFFGGDPASQMPHALAGAQALAKQGVVVCWETAGTAHPKLMDRGSALLGDRRLRQVSPEWIALEGGGAAPGPSPGTPGRWGIGAIIFPPQIELIEAHVRDAVSKGAKVINRRCACRGRGRALLRAHGSAADVDHSMQVGIMEGRFGLDAAGDAGPRRDGGDPARQPGTWMGCRHPSGPATWRRGRGLRGGSRPRPLVDKMCRCRSCRGS